MKIIEIYGWGGREEYLAPAGANGKGMRGNLEQGTKKQHTKDTRYMGRPTHGACGGSNVHSIRGGRSKRREGREKGKFTPRRLTAFTINIHRCRPRAWQGSTRT